LRRNVLGGGFLQRHVDGISIHVRELDEMLPGLLGEEEAFL